MSWDIIVQDLPAAARTIREIPNDFRPVPLGPRSEIIAKIKEVAPSANFANPAWGLILGQDWSIEVNIGDDEVCRSFAFHVRGGDGAVAAVAAILEHLKLRALDLQSSDFFDAGRESLESFGNGGDIEIAS